MRKLLNFRHPIAVFIFFIFLYGCEKKEDSSDNGVANSLTLFKLDNKNNDVDLTANDTVSSQAGVSGKFIPVNGATGAANGLDTIRIQLFSTSNVLLNTVNITTFFRPEYHVINTQLLIPPTELGKVYKVVVTVIDKTKNVLKTESFYGVDVVSCDPLPPCIVNNQITVLVETPAGTPDENLYLFGSLNGWNRGDQAFKLHKNPNVPNCYCVTIPFPPGYTDWQVNEVYVTRGLWENDAVNADKSVFVVKYTTTDLGPLWKIKVPRWRDQ